MYDSMAGSVAMDKRTILVSQDLAIGKGFGKYAPETEREVRKPKIVKDERIERLEKAYHELDSLISMPEYEYALNIHAFYDRFLAFLIEKNLPTASTDIESFAIYLEALQAEKYFFEKTGLFISFLMAQSQDHAFTLHIAHLVRPIRFIGFQNSKQITINGCAGESVGAYMTGGSISINGNAGSDLGWYLKNGTITVSGDVLNNAATGMEDGSVIIEGHALDRAGQAIRNGVLIIKGNAGEHAGLGMKGGKIHIGGDAAYACGGKMDGGSITVEGNTGKYLGHKMEAGRIHVKGNVGALLGEEMRGGEIYVDGKIDGFGRWILHGKIYQNEKLILDK